MILLHSSYLLIITCSWHYLCGHMLDLFMQTNNYFTINQDDDASSQPSLSRSTSQASQLSKVAIATKLVPAQSIPMITKSEQADQKMVSVEKPQTDQTSVDQEEEEETVEKEATINMDIDKPESKYVLEASKSDTELSEKATNSKEDDKSIIPANGPDGNLLDKPVCSTDTLLKVSMETDKDSESTNQTTTIQKEELSEMTVQNTSPISEKLVCENKNKCGDTLLPAVSNGTNSSRIDSSNPVVVDSGNSTELVKNEEQSLSNTMVDTTLKQLDSVDECKESSSTLPDTSMVSTSTDSAPETSFINAEEGNLSTDDLSAVKTAVQSDIGSESLPSAASLNQPAHSKTKEVKDAPRDLQSVRKKLTNDTYTKVASFKILNYQLIKV